MGLASQEEKWSYTGENNIRLKLKKKMLNAERLVTVTFRKDVEVEGVSLSYSSHLLFLAVVKALGIFELLQLRLAGASRCA